MRRILTVSVGLLLLLGCGGKANKGGLSGTLTYKGQPVNGATLLLYPASGAGADAIAIPVAQDGTFRSSGVPAGDYKIVVQGTAGNSGTPSMKGVSPEKQAEAQAKLQAAQGGSAATIPFPDKYKDAKQTTLTCTVASGETKLTLELTD